MEKDTLTLKEISGLPASQVHWPSATLENAHPADAADHLENLPIEQRVQEILRRSGEETAEIVAEMERHDRIDLMTKLSPEAAANLLENMSPDDATDILAELDDDVRLSIFRHLESDEARTISQLLKFDPDTAGGVMNTEILVLDQELTADQAIALIRSEVEHTEIPYYAYVVDAKRHLLGVISLRELLLSRPGRKLHDFLKDQNLIYVNYDADKEVVSRLIGRYNLLALPVVDHEQRLLGVISVDDVIDIIHDEASEDMQRMVGAGSDETVDSPWTYSIRKRLPWLVMNLLNSALAAWVVHLFQGNIAQMAVLAVLMPIVANQAGNTGQQALAVMIRQLALEQFDRKKVWFAVLREVKIGVVSGLAIAMLAVTVVYLVSHNFRLAAVMAVALAADMVLGALTGASIPLILRSLGRDPAQASSIFLTAMTDSAGFFIFLGLAGIFLF